MNVLNVAREVLFGMLILITQIMALMRKGLSTNAIVANAVQKFCTSAQTNQKRMMLVRWKDELLAADDKKVGIVCDYIESTYGGHVVDSGKAKIRVYLKQYSVEEVISAFDEAYLRTRGDYRFTLDLLPKCAYYARHPIAPDVQQILYLRKILFNRLKFVNARQAYALIEQALYERGISFDDIKHLCCSCTNWTDFKTQIGELTKDG